MHTEGASAPLLIGRELKSLTPAELEDLLVLAGTKSNTLEEPDPREVTLEPGEIRLHSVYNIIYRPGNRIHCERIEVSVWDGDGGDCEADIRHVEIRAGEVVDFWGGQNNAVAVVKWFLDHGWKWSDAK